MNKKKHLSKELEIPSREEFCIPMMTAWTLGDFKLFKRYYKGKVDAEQFYEASFKRAFDALKELNNTVTPKMASQHGDKTDNSKKPGIIDVSSADDFKGYDEEGGNGN